jgi:hypothetical protein
MADEEEEEGWRTTRVLPAASCGRSEVPKGVKCVERKEVY